MKPEPTHPSRRAWAQWAALFLLLGVGIAATAPAIPLHAQETPVFLPLVEGAPLATPTPTPTATSAPTATSTPTASPTQTPKPGDLPTPIPTRVTTTGGLPLIHILPIEQADVLDQAAVFWFGQISPSSNAVDVRVGYTPSELVIYLAIFDRRLWHDVTPDAATRTDWDAVTLLLSRPAAAGGSEQRWRVVAQMNFAAAPGASRAVEQWSGGGWMPSALPVTTMSGWRGENLNDDADDRGWAQTFRIPLSALGLSAQSQGALLRMGLIVHDRDQQTGPMVDAQSWPTGVKDEDPATWGTLQIGSLQWQPPAAQPGGEVTVRRPAVNDPSVPDAGVGGTTGNLCGGKTSSFWDVWPNANWGHVTDANVQNQIDTADWPCYARYYVTFPLDSVPAGKAIVGATLTLHQYGNTGEIELAKPSFLQVLRAGAAWDEKTITWNNAPQALENVAARWVTPVQSTPAWPGIAWEWDVSKAVADAYAEGQPVRLVLYSADSNYHSGKLFVSSDTGDWNVAGRPALHVVWGNP